MIVGPRRRRSASQRTTTSSSARTDMPAWKGWSWF